MTQHMHNGYTKRKGDRRKKKKKIHEEKTHANLPNLMKNSNVEIQQTPSRINTKRSTKTPHNKNAESQRQGKTLESKKRKMNHHLEGNFNKVKSWLHTRNKARRQ